MMSTLKNWWFALLGLVAVVLDQGFDVIEPFLNQLGASDRLVQIIRVIFGVYAIYVLKKQMPSQNPDKLQDLVDRKSVQAKGDPIPDKGF